MYLCSAYDDRWYVITPEAEAELQALFADVSQQSAFVTAFINFMSTQFGD